MQNNFSPGGGFRRIQPNSSPLDPLPDRNTVLESSHHPLSPFETPGEKFVRQFENRKQGERTVAARIFFLEFQEEIAGDKSFLEPYCNPATVLICVFTR